MQQTDRDKFLVAMKQEVTLFSEHDFWIKFPRREMKDHFKSERNMGKFIKQEQLTMIWSFKQKRKPDGTLDKYKARHCCHGGQ